MPPSALLVPATLTLALAALLPASAGAQDTQADLYIDVATHTVPGMQALGALGRMAGAVSGGNASYGMARHPGMPGKYMDVALHNRRQPGTPASQAVPGGLGLGSGIDLLPPPLREQRSSGNDGGGIGHGLADGANYRVLYYWGCGERAGAGQPREYSMTVRDGRPVQGGQAITPRQVASNHVNPGPEHALWPNTSSRQAVPTRASLVGQHHVTGNGLPDSMRFDLGGEHDFLPELRLQSDDAEQGMALRWDGVDGARAYFIHATASDGDTVVMWSSSEDGYAGHELFDFLPEALVAEWTKTRTLLGPDARECRIPQEVLAGGSAPMVQMIAYGNVRSIAEPRPAGAASDWRPGWNVHVRNKSTAMLMPGGVGAAANPQDAAKPTATEAAKGLLRGLIRR